MNINENENEFDDDDDFIIQRVDDPINDKVIEEEKDTNKAKNNNVSKEKISAKSEEETHSDKTTSSTNNTAKKSASDKTTIKKSSNKKCSSTNKVVETNTSTINKDIEQVKSKSKNTESQESIPANNSTRNETTENILTIISIIVVIIILIFIAYIESNKVETNIDNNIEINETYIEDDQINEAESSAKNEIAISQDVEMPEKQIPISNQTGQISENKTIFNRLLDNINLYDNIFFVEPVENNIKAMFYYPSYPNDFTGLIDFTHGFVTYLFGDPTNTNIYYLAVFNSNGIVTSIDCYNDSYTTLDLSANTEIKSIIETIIKFAAGNELNNIYYKTYDYISNN